MDEEERVVQEKTLSYLFFFNYYFKNSPLHNDEEAFVVVVGVLVDVVDVDDVLAVGGAPVQLDLAPGGEGGGEKTQERKKIINMIRRLIVTLGMAG